MGTFEIWGRGSFGAEDVPKFVVVEVGQLAVVLVLHVTGFEGFCFHD